MVDVFHDLELMLQGLRQSTVLVLLTPDEIHDLRVTITLVSDLEGCSGHPA